MRWLPAALASALGWTAAGCAAPGLPVPTVQRAYEQCPWDGAARALSSFEGASQAAAARSPAGDSASSALDVAPDARLLVLHLGAVPSSGHTVALDPGSLRIEAGLLRLRAMHRAPPADAVVRTVMTRPCLALVVPRARWSRAEVTWQP